MSRIRKKANDVFFVHFIDQALHVDNIVMYTSPLDESQLAWRNNFREDRCKYLEEHLRKGTQNMDTFKGVGGDALRATLANTG